MTSARLTADQFLENRFDLSDAGQWSELVAGEPVQLEAPDLEHGTAVLNLCGDDAELRRRVEKLLVAHSQAGSFMNDADASNATVAQPITEQPGTVIGPYKLLQQIGEGIRPTSRGRPDHHGCSPA